MTEPFDKDFHVTELVINARDDESKKTFWPQIHCQLAKLNRVVISNPMMSVKKPGSNVKTPAIIRKILSSIFILVLKYPVNPTDTQVIPIIAVIIFGITYMLFLEKRNNGQNNTRQN